MPNSVLSGRNHCKGRYSIFCRGARQDFSGKMEKIFIALVLLHSGMNFCHGKQIVLAIDKASKITEEDIQMVATADITDNTTFAVFHANQSMSTTDLLLAARGWLAADNVTTIIDMTSNCRTTSIAAVTSIPLLRSSSISCYDVLVRDVINIRPTLETYTNAAFSYLGSIGSCLARVVLLTEYQIDLTEIPKCYKGTAVPLLARAVGTWPLNEEQTNSTQAWLKGMALRLSFHYVIVVGNSDFLNGCFEQGWLHLLPATFFQWMFVVTDKPSFNCSHCPYGTSIFYHSHQTLELLPLPFANRTNSVDMSYLRKAIQTAREMQDEENTLYQVSQKNFDNLTLDGQIVMENNTVRKLGTWTHGSGWQTDEFIKDRLNDPSIIRVATIESPPFVFRTDDENGTHYSGYAIDVLDEITKRMNISYRFIEPSDGMFGVRLPNGTWNGVIGDILSGSVDIAVGSLTVSAEREEVVDFTTPFYEFAGIEILVKEVPKEQNLLFFVTVFSEPMWGAWFGVLLLTGFLLAVFDYLSPFSVRNTRGKSGGGDGGDGGGGDKKDREKEAGKDTFDLKEGLWLVTASFTLSGPESTPRTPSSRMLVAGFWFFCTIIMANYTANLAAFLTTSRLTTPINSLADLASQSKIRYSVVDGTTTMSYFERMARIESNFYELWKNISSNMVSAGTLAKSEIAVWDYPLGDTYVKVWSDMEKTGLLASTQEGLDKVMAGDFALIDEAPSLQYAISQYCGLTTIGKQFSTKSYAFALPQGSPLTEQVSNYILKLQSETILEKLKQLWWKDSAEGCVEVDESEGLSFTTLGGVFLLAGVGVAAGLLLCFLETGWAWLSAKRRKKSDVIPPVTSRTDLVQEFDMDSKYDTITNVDDVTAEIQMSAF